MYSALSIYVQSTNFWREILFQWENIKPAELEKISPSSTPYSKLYNQAIEEVKFFNRKMLSTLIMHTIQSI